MINDYMKTLERISDYQYIFIYGAGYYGRIVKCFLDENHVHINGFIVTDLNDSDEEMMVLETPVHSVRWLSQLSIDDVYIIIAGDENKRDIFKEKISMIGVKQYFCVDNEMIHFFLSKLKFNNEYPTQSNINVFLYHSVGKTDNNERGLVIDKELFSKQLLYIKENYKILKSDEEWKGIKEKAAVLTFDDGYCDFYDTVLPLLEEYEIPGTVFVTTGCVNKERGIWGDELERMIFDSDYPGIYVCDGEVFSFGDKNNKKESFWKLRSMLKKLNSNDRSKKLQELSSVLDNGKGSKHGTQRIMTEEEIKKCSLSPYVTIGAHTVNHCCLSRESIDVQRYEMAESKKMLEEIIGKKVSVFAYPYGEKDDFTNDTISLAREMGYKRVFAAYRGLANSETEYGRIPRNDISKNHSLEESVRELRIIELCYADAYI